MTALLSLFTGSNTLIAGLLAVLAAIAAAWFKGRSSGVKSERDKQTVGELVATQDQLEMYREATAAEKEAAQLSDDDARKEAMKWVK